VTVFPGALLAEQGETLQTPEARSPFIAPDTRQLSIRGGDGSPIATHRYTNSGNLFVVNPSDTPGPSPIPPTLSAFKEEKSALGFINNKPNDGMAVTKDGLTTEINPFFQSAMVATVPATQAGAVALGAVQNSLNNGVPILAVPAPTAQQKRSLFSRNKSPQRLDVRALGISKPIMEESPALEGTPFARMKTVDLETANESERARRAEMAARSNLIAGRPAPAPPTTKPAGSFFETMNAKQMELIETNSVSSKYSSDDGSKKSMESAAMSTSASLSPGREEVRRRSPRISKSFEDAADAQGGTEKSPMRKRLTGGPPSSSRIRVQSIEIPPLPQEAQTIMFMSDIIYDNPSAVQEIMDLVKTPAKTPVFDPDLPLTRAQQYALNSANSVIHRPRPYKRQSEKDRQIFPSEPSPYHRRTKSGGSLYSRKSILLSSSSGSPTRLPPLPAPPTSASNLPRLLAGGKALTANERLQLLFPAPPGVGLRKRRSSVPSIPRIPSALLASAPKSVLYDASTTSRSSRRSTMLPQSRRDTLVPTVPALTPEDAMNPYSASEYRFLTENDPMSWLVETPQRLGSMTAPMAGENRRSSILYQDPGVYDEEMSPTSSHDGTQWESLYSAHSDMDNTQDIEPALQNNTDSNDAAQPEYSEDMPVFLESPLEGAYEDEDEEYDPGEDQQEMMTIMLDPEEAASISRSNSQKSQNSTGSRGSASEMFEESAEKTWHRRIGDEIPSFSERPNMSRSRAMTPPAPIRIANSGRQVQVVVHEPEPVGDGLDDSPQRALEAIQEQLRNFEEVNRGSVGSLLRRLPEGTPDTGMEQNNRLRLLESLEAEMAGQENQWLQMQLNIARNSVSTIGVLSPPADLAVLLNGSSPSLSIRSALTAEQVTPKPSEIDGASIENAMLTLADANPDESRASTWQRRLAEAQMEYLTNAPGLTSNRADRGINFLSVSRAKIASPTPPESIDSGTDFELGSDGEFGSPVNTLPTFLPESYKQERPKSLWVADAQAFQVRSVQMWNPMLEDPKPEIDSPEPPARSLRPFSRQSKDNLTIKSNNLWSRQGDGSDMAALGLWDAKPLPALPAEDFEVMEAQLMEIPFEETQFEQTLFEETQFEETQFEETQFEQTLFGETQFEEAQLEEARFEETQFEETQFEQTQFEETQLEQTLFEETQFEETQIQDTQILQPLASTSQRRVSERPQRRSKRTTVLPDIRKSCGILKSPF
jgi:hypothetical protein